MKLLVVTLILLVCVSVLFADTAPSAAISEKVDVALGLTIFAPKKPKAIKVNQGLLNLDSYYWRVYPLVYQTMDKTHKVAGMTIELIGPMNGGFTNAPLTFNIDGDVSTIPVEWKNLRTFYGENAVLVNIALRDKTFRRLASAKDVYLTILLPGSTQRYGVHLAGDRLTIFQTMLAEYDSLDPHDDPEAF